jgi:PleD family two-component response regulator
MLALGTGICKIRDIPHCSSGQVLLRLIQLRDNAMALHSPVETTFEEDAGRRTLMLQQKQIRVLIVDDHSGVRRGIRNLLQTAKDMIIVGEGGNGAEAIELAATRNPDILLLDI